MNKHVRNVIFAVGILLLGLSWALPAVSSAAPSYDVAIPLEYARVKPKAAGADCNAVSPVKKTKVTGDDCIKIPNATGTSAGVYYFVSKLEQIPKASISGVSVTSIASSGTAAGSPVAGIKYSVVNNELRISGLKKGEAYSFSFSFSDSESPDIQKLQSNIKKECDYFTQHDTTKPSLNYQTNDKNAQRAAFKLQDFDGENDLGNGTTFGCTQYSSAQVLSGTNADEVFQFLPPIALTTLDNDGNGYTFTHAGQKLGAVDLSKQVANAVPASTATTTGTTGTTTEAASSTCGFKDGGAMLNWIVCPLTSILQNAATKFGDILQSLLYFPADRIFNDDGSAANEGMYQAWTTFRNVGLGLVLIAGLVMVISQALGLELLDAYTIRKLMPRLAIALIGIALSWPLMNFVISFFNDIGTLTQALIVAPFKSMPVVNQSGAGAAGVYLLNSVLGVVGGAVLAAYLYTLGVMGSLALLFTIIMAIFIGLLVLAVRWSIIAVCIILAPLAIAAYVLPGTQKLWGFWKNTLLTSLFMFPIVMALIAAGDVMARVATAINANYFFVLIVYFAPYFMLPFAFKMAGGLMSTIFSLANDKSRGIFDRARNFRSNTAKRRWGEYASGKRGGDRNVVGRLAAYTTAATDPGVGFRGLRTREGRLAARNSLRERANADMLKNATLSSLSDDYALTVADQAEGRLSDDEWSQRYIAEAQRRGQTRTRAQALAARATLETGLGAKVGTHAMRTAAWKGHVISKTGYGDDDPNSQADGDEGMRELFEAAGEMVRRGDMTEVQAMGIIKEATRHEYSSVSYGHGMDVIRRLADGTAGAGHHLNAGELQGLFDSSLDHMQPSQLAGARHETIRTVSEHTLRRLDAAFQGGDNAEIGAAMAAVAGLRDSINYYNPDNADILARMLASMPAGTTGTTVRDYEEQLRAGGRSATGDPTAEDLARSVAFIDHRKEWATQNPELAELQRLRQEQQQGMGAGALPTPSDMRLKQNVHYLETLASGIRLYRFNYVWGGPTYVGVIAQEILRIAPEAVGINVNGFYCVDYAQLGLRMTTYSKWQKRQSYRQATQNGAKSLDSL